MGVSGGRYTLGVGQAVDLQVGTEIAMWGIFAA